MEPHQVPRNSGVHTQSPTDRELYFKGYMETPVNCAPPQSGYGGMIESMPPATTHVGMMQFRHRGRAVMSIGPNAPTLAEVQYRQNTGAPPQTVLYAHARYFSLDFRSET